MRLRGKRSSELLDQTLVRLGETAARRSFLLLDKDQEMTFCRTSVLGTFRTSRDVRVMSAFSGNSEVAVSSPDFRFDPSPTSSAQPKVFHPFI